MILQSYDPTFLNVFFLRKKNRKQAFTLKDHSLVEM